MNTDEEIAFYEEQVVFFAGTSLKSAIDEYLVALHSYKNLENLTDKERCIVLRQLLDASQQLEIEVDREYNNTFAAS